MIQNEKHVQSHICCGLPCGYGRHFQEIDLDLRAADQGPVRSSDLFGVGGVVSLGVVTPKPHVQTSTEVRSCAGYLTPSSLKVYWAAGPG